MAKTLKDFLEVYKPKSKDEQRFVDKHVTIKHKDANGNDDDVFKASKVKAVKRSTEHGYDAGQDEAVYENVEQIDEISPELRGKWLNKTWKKHLRHVDDTPEQIKNGKPQMPAARQKIFGKADAKQNAHYMQKSKEDHAKKLAARTPKVHDLRHMSHGEVYDHTQTSDKVHDGDILHVKGGVAAMVQAWPVMIHGKSKTLHKFKEGVTLHTTDNGIYKKSAQLADKTHGIKEDWAHEDVDALLTEAFEKIEEGLTEEQLDEAADIAAALMEEFDGLDESEAYSIAVASVTGVDLDEEAEELEETTYHNTPENAKKIGWADDRIKPFLKGDKTSKYVKHDLKKGEFHYTNEPGNLKEAEELDEISDTKRKDYINKAHSDYKNVNVPGESTKKMQKRLEKRATGLNRALTKEDLEEGVGVRVHNFTDFKREAQDLADHLTHDGKVHFHTKEVSAGGKTWHQTSSNIHNMRNGGFYSYGHFNHTGKGPSEEGHGRHVTAFELDENLQLDELSRKTLGSYATKALDDTGDYADSGNRIAAVAGDVAKKGDKESAKHYGAMAADRYRKSANRAAGARTAIKKLTKEDIISSAINRFLPEDYELPALEDRLVKKLEGLSENNIGALVGLFRSLNSLNQELMYEECDTKEGINQLLDMTIEARGK